MKAKPAYYNVQATRDGIIVYAFPRRKPTKGHNNPKPQIDEDGICDWYEDDADEAARSFADWGKGARMTAITTHLNIRRLLRQLVQPRLAELESTVTQLATQLARIEEKLDYLTVETSTGKRKPHH